MTQEDVIKHWTGVWCSLRAWRAPITMQVTFKPHKGTKRMGVAHSRKGQACVYLTGDLAYDLATVLHELAHLAAPNSEQHGTHWREIFVAAAAEALGDSVDDYETDAPYRELDAQVEEATRAWLTRTGQAGMLRGIGVMS